MFTISNTNTLVMMVGPSGAGKSTLANNLFVREEIISSDSIREELTGSKHRHDRDRDVWEEVENRVLHLLIQNKRAVIDATNIRDADRKTYLHLVRDLGIQVIYIVVDRPLYEKKRDMGDRKEWVVEKHDSVFNSNIKNIMSGDGVAKVLHHGISIYNVESSSGTFTRYENIHRPHVDTWNLNLNPKGLVKSIYDRGFRHIRILGDIHSNLSGFTKAINSMPNNTFLISLGDIIDYGKNPLEVVNLMASLVDNQSGLMIRGNHERKVYNFITQEARLRRGIGSGFSGQETNGSSITFNILKSLPMHDREKWEEIFICLVDRSPDMILMKDVQKTWAFVHGAIAPHMLNMTGTFRFPQKSYEESLALFGQIDETMPKLESGFPNRIYKWVDDVPDNTTIVVGHDIRSKEIPLFVTGKAGGSVSFLDTGSSKGGKLSGLDVDIIEQRNGLFLRRDKFINFE